MLTPMTDRNADKHTMVVTISCNHYHKHTETLVINVMHGSLLHDLQQTILQYRFREIEQARKIQMH